MSLHAACSSSDPATSGDAGTQDASGEDTADSDAATDDATREDGASPGGCSTVTSCTNSSQCVAIAGTTCNTATNKCQKVLCAAEGESCSEKDHCKAGACVDNKCSKPTSGTGSDYLAFCMPFLVVANPDQSIRFHAIVVSSNTTLSMSAQPLLAGSTSIDNTVGTRFPTPPASASISGGKAVLSFGNTPTIPKTANPLTGTDVSIQNLRLNVSGVSAAMGDFCGTMDGTLLPSGTVIDPGKSVCLFRKASSPTAIVPVPPFSDFVCP